MTSPDPWNAINNWGPVHFLESGFGGLFGDDSPVLHKIVPWPVADDKAIRAAAACWRQLAKDAQQALDEAQTMTTSINSFCAGPAIDAFTDYWARYGDPNRGLIPLAIESCQDMAKSCEDYADQLAAAKKQLEALGLQVGATVVLAAVLACWSFGSSEILGMAVADGLDAEALKVQSQLLADIATALARISPQLTTRFAAGALFSVVDQMVNDQINTALGLPNKSLLAQSGDVFKASLVNGAVAGLPLVASAGADVAAQNLAGDVNQISPQLAAMMTMAPEWLKTPPADLTAQVLGNAGVNGIGLIDNTSATLNDLQTLIGLAVQRAGGPAAPEH